MTYANPTNITSLMGLFQYANQVTNNVFVILLLLTIYIVPLIYLIMRGYRWEQASMSAGFFVAISAILLRVAEITTVDRYIFLAIATIIIPLVIIMLKEKD